EPGDHLLAHQAVGPARVRLAGLLGEGLRLALAPLQAQTPGDGDRVDEHGLVLVEHGRIAEAGADGVEVRLAERLLVAQRRIRAADEHREVAAFLPGARPDRVAGPSFDGEIARLEVEEQGGLGRQRPELRGLADTALADQHALDAALLGQALVGGDDGEVHARPSLSEKACSMRYAPSAPRLRARS